MAARRFARFAAPAIYWTNFFITGLSDKVRNTLRLRSSFVMPSPFPKLKLVSFFPCVVLTRSFQND